MTSTMKGNHFLELTTSEFDTAICRAPASLSPFVSCITIKQCSALLSCLYMLGISPRPTMIAGAPPMPSPHFAVNPVITIKHRNLVPGYWQRVIAGCAPDGAISVRAAHAEESNLSSQPFVDCSRFNNSRSAEVFRFYW